MPAMAPEAMTGGLPRSDSPATAALVERAKAGDAAAFEDLMRLYERRVIALGMQMGLTREDALDACQDAFIKVFKYIHRFRSGEVFFRWLYRLAVNVILDHLRSRPTQMVSMEDLQAPDHARLRDQARSPQDRLETADLAGRVKESLVFLSRRERIVFVLRDLQEIPGPDVGRILGLSQVTVRRHSMSARQKIRARLNGLGR